jgi:hypothetical protein
MSPVDGIGRLFMAWPPGVADWVRPVKGACNIARPRPPPRTRRNWRRAWGARRGMDIPGSWKGTRQDKRVDGVLQGFGQRVFYRMLTTTALPGTLTRA